MYFRYIYETMVLNALNIRQRRIMISERREANEVSPKITLRLLSGESFQVMMHEEDFRQRPENFMS